MTRVHPLGEAPEMLALKLSVSALTAVNLYAFASWYYQHWDALEDAFLSSGELLEDKRAWLREVFVCQCRLNPGRKV